MSHLQVETIVLFTLILLWITIVLGSGKCCRVCGKPEADCTCHWH